MILEINQIKRWLARKFKLRTEGRGMDLRVIDSVPDGEYKIRIGVSRTTALVTIKDGGISIK